MAKGSWEESAKDVREDKKLAKKYKMSYKDWESSSMNAKHDKHKSTKGFKKGGVTTGEMKAKGRNLARVANQRSK